MNYKGYTIKEQTEPKFMGASYVFFKGITYDGSPMKHANTLDEAAAEIDELTCNDPSPDDKLKIAVQCIEANKEEFVYRTTEPNISGERHAVFTHHIELCAKALKAIQE